MTSSAQSDNSMPRIGGCRCGGVVVRAAGQPLQVSYCHCTDCRKASGAPVSVFVGFPDDRIRIDGDLTTYRNGSTSRGYCPACGAPVVYDDDQLDSRWLMIGILDAPETCAPQLHAFFSERLAWFDTTDALPRHKRFSVMREVEE